MTRNTSQFLAFVLPTLACIFSASGIRAQSLWTCEADIILEGSTDGDHRGWSIDTSGNWNNDSYTGGRPMMDILAGGYEPGMALGSAELFISVGQDLGFPILPHCPFTGGRVRIIGEQQTDFFGHAVGFLGDIDDDGRDDLAVTMIRGPKIGPTWTERGAVYVFLSSDTNPNGIPAAAPATGVVTVSATQASLIIRGTTDGYRLGRSIAGIGDWEGDGDGVTDFLVGAPGNDDYPTSFPGLVYMVSGAKVLAAIAASLHEVDVTTVLVDDELEPDPPMPGVIQGSAGGDRMGYVVAHIGEAGDTAHGSDFAVGAPQFNDPDKVFVSQFDNSSNPGTGYVKVFLGQGAHPFKIFGTQEKERFGFALAGKVNVDGDAGGLHDLIIGSPFWDEVGYTFPNPGKVFVYRAVGSILLGEMVGVNSSIALSTERLGFGVAGLTDLNGDARGEFAVGSFGYPSAPVGPFTPPSGSPCAPCPKLSLDMTQALAVGGGLSGRCQVVSYNGTGLVALANYVGDGRDSAGVFTSLLNAAGPGADPAVVIGSFRWGDTNAGLIEVGRLQIFLWP